MRTTSLAVALLACSSMTLFADIYIEIDFASSGPDGQTSGDLTLGDPAPLSVWIWADTPDFTLVNINLELNGQSMLGVPNNGGSVMINQLGTLDPDGHFMFPLSDGTMNGDQTIVSEIFVGNLIFPGEPLPTSIDDAWLLYTDFTATALDSGAGIMPIVTIDTGLDPTDIHTFGLYQTPTPGTLALLGFGALATSKRRR